MVLAKLACYLAPKRLRDASTKLQVSLDRTLVSLVSMNSDR